MIGINSEIRKFPKFNSKPSNSCQRKSQGSPVIKMYVVNMVWAKLHGNPSSSILRLVIVVPAGFGSLGVMK